MPLLLRDYGIEDIPKNKNFKNTKAYQQGHIITLYLITLLKNNASESLSLDKN